MRRVGLNFRTESEFEEKLRKLESIRDEDVDPVVIDMTDEEVVNNVEIDNDFEDSVSYTINNADEILYNTCGSTEPSKPNQKCDTCDQWVHNRCCIKPALTKNVCLRRFYIFYHQNLNKPLISPLEDMEQ